MTERGPLVEAGPLATDPAVSITREEEEGAEPVGAGFGGSCWGGCWVSSILWINERKRLSDYMTCCYRDSIKLVLVKSNSSLKSKLNVGKVFLIFGSHGWIVSFPNPLLF